MKTIKHMAMFFATLLMMCAFVSCDNDDSDWDNNFPKNFSVTVDGCERVGSVLIADLTVTNKSGKDVDDLSFAPDAANDIGFSHDDLNNDLHINMQFAINDGDFQGMLSKVTMKANESIKLTLRITDFDATNTAKYVWLYVQTISKTLGMTNMSGIALDKLSITDHRVLSNGVQTNDRELAYTFVKAQRDANTNDVYLYFKLKNNTGKDLCNFVVMGERWQNVRDNLGNTYDQLFGTDTNNMSGRVVIPNLEANGELTLVVKAVNVAAEATHLSGEFKLWPGNYVVDDDTVHFFDLAL